MVDLTYRFLAVGLLSGDVLGEVTPASASFEQKINEPGSATLTFHLRQVDRALIEPNQTAIYIIRNDQCLFAGMATAVTANGNDRTVQVGYVELTRYLWRRRLRTDLLYTESEGGTEQAVPQTTIASDLIAYTNDPGLSLVPRVVNVQGVQDADEFVLRERSYYGYERHVIGELLTGLTNVINGLDYALRVRYDANENRWVREVLLSDNLSRDLPIEWVSGRDFGTYSVATDAGAQANRIDATGAGEGPDLLIATAVAEPGNYPRLDDVTAYRSVSRSSTLQEHADGDLLATVLPLNTPDVDVALRDLPVAGGQVLPGDTVLVRIDDGAAQYDDRARILSWKVDWSRGNPVKVDLTLATVPLTVGAAEVTLRTSLLQEPSGTIAGGFPAPKRTDLLTTIQRLERRIETLERPSALALTPDLLPEMPDPTTPGGIVPKQYADRGLRLVDTVQADPAETDAWLVLGNIPAGAIALFSTVQGAVTALGTTVMSINGTSGPFIGHRWGITNLGAGNTVSATTNTSVIPCVPNVRIGITQQVWIDLSTPFPTFNGSGRGHDTADPTTSAFSLFGGRWNTDMGSVPAPVTSVQWRASNGEAWRAESVAHLYAVVP